MKLPTPTKIFLEEFLSSGAGQGCAICKGPSVKKLCQKHLYEARIRFRFWTKERVAKKLCIQCNKRSHKIVSVGTGELRQGVRCRYHREISRVRALKWAREHRTAISAEYHRRRAKGVCTNNPAHGFAYKGHTKCRSCHIKNRRNTIQARTKGR